MKTNQIKRQSAVTMKTKIYRLQTSGYTALGVGSDPATQDDADQYDTPCYGYVDKAEEDLEITTSLGNWTYSSLDDAERVAEYIQSAECADCYGVAVKNAEVVEEEADATRKPLAQ